MGEIVAASVVSHVPTIMLPEATRKNMGGGSDTSIATGMRTIREGLDTAKADTLVIFDTHWFTTVEHLVAGAEHYTGVYTSEELPNLISDFPYDHPGAPKLAKQIEKVAKKKRSAHQM